MTIPLHAIWLAQDDPKKNTAVLFDSNILHCGCNPIKSSMRGVINFIFKDNENNFLYR